MSCSGEGHSRQFIPLRLGKNVNMTHTLRDVQKHNMVACVSTEGFKERLLRKDALDVYSLIFLFKILGLWYFAHSFVLYRTVERK